MTTLSMGKVFFMLNISIGIYREQLGSYRIFRITLFSLLLSVLRSLHTPSPLIHFSSLCHLISSLLAPRKRPSSEVIHDWLTPWTLLGSFFFQLLLKHLILLIILSLLKLFPSSLINDIVCSRNLETLLVTTEI